MKDTLEINCPMDPQGIKRILFNGADISPVGAKWVVFAVFPDKTPSLTVEYITAGKEKTT